MLRIGETGHCARLLVTTPLPGPLDDITMIRGLTILLACQLVGEVAARGSGLPVPGPVLGLVVLVLGLVGAERLGRTDPDELPRTDVGQVSDGLLRNLALLFVPAGVGVVQHLGLLGAWGVPIALALVGSTLLTLLATVGVFLLVKRMAAGREAGR